MVVRYGTNEGNGEERDRFLNDLDRIVDRVVNYTGRPKQVDWR